MSNFDTSTHIYVMNEQLSECTDRIVEASDSLLEGGYQ